MPAQEEILPLELRVKDQSLPFPPHPFFLSLQYFEHFMFHSFNVIFVPRNVTIIIL